MKNSIYIYICVCVQSIMFIYINLKNNNKSAFICELEYWFTTTLSKNKSAYICGMEYWFKSAYICVYLFKSKLEIQACFFCTPNEINFTITYIAHYYVWWFNTFILVINRYLETKILPHNICFIWTHSCFEDDAGWRK